MLIARALLIWLLLMVVESVHGALRTTLLAPAIGDMPARRLSVLTGAVLIFLVALATIRWIGAIRARQLLGIGALWVALMDWSRIASDYDLSSGGLMPLGLICMLLTPWVAARLRKI